jgi:peptidoglycan hydrolase FlgJ
MGISPPTDLVVDVMKNAQTSRVQQVVSKLKALSAGGGADFGATMTSTGASGTVASAAPQTADEQAQAQAAAATPSGLAFSGTTLTSLRNAHALSNRPVQQFSTTQPPAATLKKFEGMVLAKFLDTMMPQTSSVFGSGTAGSAWKTMLTEKIGNSIADVGGIGIAASIARANAGRGSSGGNGDGA